MEQALVQQEVVDELLVSGASRYERERESGEKRWAAYGFDEKLCACLKNGGEKGESVNSVQEPRMMDFRRFSSFSISSRRFEKVPAPPPPPPGGAIPGGFAPGGPAGGAPPGFTGGRLGPGGAPGGPEGGFAAKEGVLTTDPPGPGGSFGPGGAVGGPPPGGFVGGPEGGAVGGPAGGFVGGPLGGPPPGGFVGGPPPGGFVGGPLGGPPPGGFTGGPPAAPALAGAPPGAGVLPVSNENNRLAATSLLTPPLTAAGASTTPFPVFGTLILIPDRCLLTLVRPLLKSFR
ncbi:MAG: hypothetical protein ACTSU5_03390 [Promethearchaeota archaeon]